MTELGPFRFFALEAKNLTDPNSVKNEDIWEISIDLSPWYILGYILSSPFLGFWNLIFFSFWFVPNVYQAGGNWFLPQTKIFFGNLIYLWKGKPWSTSWIYMSKLCLWWPTLLYIHVTYMHYAVQVHSIVYWIWHRCEMFLYYIHT